MCRDGRRCGDCNEGRGKCCNKCESIMRYEGPDIDCVGVATGDTYETVTRKLSDFICNNLSVDGEDGVGISDITYDPETDTMTINMTDGTSKLITGLKGPKGDPGDSEGIDIVAGENITVTQEVIGGITTYTINSTGGGSGCCGIIADTWEGIKEIKDVGNLQENRRYHITDEDIWVDAISPTEFSSEATRRFPIVKDVHYTPNLSTNFLGIYGQTIAKGSVPNSSGSTVYRVIWGGRVWERDTTGADTPGTTQFSILGGWTKVPTSATTYYENKMFSIDYNFNTNEIYVQRDDRGNVVKKTTISYIDYTDWGNNDIRLNVGTGILNNHKGSAKARVLDNLRSLIVNNSNLGDISFNSDGIIRDNSNTGDISRNITSGIISNSNGGKIDKNRIGGNISGNSHNGEIFNNTCNGEISGNTSEVGVSFNIRVNMNNGGILNNNATANIDIESNTNNGHIGTISVTNRASSVTDPIVNK